MIKRISAFAFFILFLSCTESWATHASLGGGSGHTGPITTVSAATSEAGRWGLDLETEFISYDSFSDEKLAEFAGQGRDVHTADHLQMYSLGLSYGITDSLAVHLRLPYIFRDNISSSEPPDEVDHHGDSRGFGDLSIHLHQRLSRSEHGDFQITLTAGVGIPTGKTSERDAQGKTFAAEFQPGSGAWDPSLGISVTKHFDRLSFDGNVLYTLVTKGAQDTDTGDIFNYNLALSYRALLRPLALDLIGELNGIWLAKEKARGEKDSNSGGNIILFSPGIRVSLAKGFMFYASYGVPVVQNWNGIQNDVDYRLVFGINFVM